MTDTTHLRKLAEAATPGPWIEAGPSFGAPLPVRLDSVVQDTGNPDDDFTICDEVCDPDDVAFIAAANPAAIIELLDTIDRLAEREAFHRVQRDLDVLALAGITKERDALAEKLAAIEAQEPVAIYLGPDGWNGSIGYCEQKNVVRLMKKGDKLYLAAGAKESK